MNCALVGDGVAIMLIGMGVVFSFLVILVIALNIMSACVKFLNKIFPEVVPEQKQPRQKRQGKDEEEVAIAIAVAARSM